MLLSLFVGQAHPLAEHYRAVYLDGGVTTVRGEGDRFSNYRWRPGLNRCGQ
jgi:hypothetical protein